jgi:murein DD-endopeptidase MepM/ murein hydrolase activator NlpD
VLWASTGTNVIKILTVPFFIIYRVTGESIKEWVLVASANEKEKRLAFEPRQDAKYVVRLQPELLRGGQYTVTIRNVASLAFPVSDKNRHSIGSKFGAPRDGGRRKHNGVDIFAPRHTPGKNGDAACECFNVSLKWSR